MKPFIFLSISLLAIPVWAQEKPAVQEPMKEAAKPAAEPKKQAAVALRKPRRWHEDARHCLELPTNTEIIKCAEEYF
jgi:hypothetical protein